MRAVFVRLIAAGACVLLGPLATTAFAAPADDTAKQAPVAQQAKQETEKAAGAPDEATDAKTPDEATVAKTPDEATEATEATEDKRICRSVKLDTSSRRKTKVCRTIEEWRELNNPR